MGWWSDNNMRLIQNNMTDLNAAMDVDRWVEQLQSFHCTVALVGVGGITSFYPTKLEYQVVSPYLPPERDLIREILDKCHAAGIRVMGRFDFGRTNQKFYDEHPDWYYHAADGRLLRCADTVTTCVTGWYQQEYSKRIVREALERYPDLDGIFFNAFGFSGWDYHGNNLGLCHCENCKRQFRAFSGMELPIGPDDPAMPVYVQFQRKTVSQALKSIQQLIRSLNPNICLSTYSPDGVDIIKNESNSGVGRALPFPLMNSSYNIAAARHVWPHQPMGNCVINATDLRWRYAGVSPELTRIRLYENIAAGGYPDYCINGVFADYPDQSSLDAAREVFRYHWKNERYYGHLVSQARVLVMRADGSRPIHDGSRSYFGVMKALKEEHIPFDVQIDQNIIAQPGLLAQYSAVLVPDVAEVSAKFLKLARESGRQLIVMAVNRELPEDLSNALGIRLDRIETDNAGAYLHTREKEIFRHFPGKDWVFVTGAVGLSAAKGWKPLLPYVEKGEFGPAERAYGYRPTETGTVLVQENVALITWALGELYQQHGYQDHKYILADLLDSLCPDIRVIRTNAHPSVELFWDDTGSGMLLQALNLSGFNGTTVEAPVPMQNVAVTVPFEAREAISLDGSPVHIKATENGTQVCFEQLNRFAAAVLKK
ncbi:MAG: family 10 glycosylhydrolase [Clostridia bacterium]|nr:family 10 glycosylhydrolase [Clostridia bacterium]